MNQSKLLFLILICIVLCGVIVAFLIPKGNDRYLITYPAGRYTASDWTDHYTIDSLGGCHYNNKVIYGSYWIEDQSKSEVK